MGYKMGQMITSKYFRKEDCTQPKILTISAVKLEEMPGDDKGEKFILYFHGEEKGMVLGTGIIHLLFSAFCPQGQDDTDMWIGQKVKMYVDPSVQMKGKVVGGLRLKTSSVIAAPWPTTMPSPHIAQTAGVPDSEFDDDIPF